MKIKYENLRFYGNALTIIQRANAIIEKFQAMGYDLTLRQLYYRFVAADLFPNKFSWTGSRWVKDQENGTINAEPNYKMLGEVISNGRRAGLVDWDAIVDRTRFLRGPVTWTDPGEMIEARARSFKIDLWENQNAYVEIWFEKDALLGVFERAAETIRLPYFSCRGYVSDSECWAAAQRIRAQIKAGKECIVLHFGDHDPSGIDMTRDIGERLALFGAANLEIRRMALNMEQVREYNPPPNPAKQTDSRFKDYESKFGDESWELDALEPDVLISLVQGAIDGVINANQWAEDEERESTMREALTAVSNRWDEVAEYALKPKPEKKPRKKSK